MCVVNKINNSSEITPGILAIRLSSFIFQTNQIYRSESQQWNFCDWHLTKYTTELICTKLQIHRRFIILVKEKYWPATCIQYWRHQHTYNHWSVTWLICFKLIKTNLHKKLVRHVKSIYVFLNLSEAHNDLPLARGTIYTRQILLEKKLLITRYCEKCSLINSSQNTQGDELMLFFTKYFLCHTLAQKIHVNIPKKDDYKLLMLNGFVFTCFVAKWW